MLISDSGALEFDFEVSGPGHAVFGKRILVTGVSSQAGIDIARAFIEHGARVIVQCNDTGPLGQAIAEALAPDATDLSIHATPLASADSIVTFARNAAAEFGGLDAVINIVPLANTVTDGAASDDAVEASVSEVLLKACLVSRVAANRMRLTLTDGIILTVAFLEPGASPNARAFAQVVRSALSAMTKAEAEAWATQGIRFNAVVPDVLGLVAPATTAREADVARLAAYLMAGKGMSLSGITFEQGLLAQG